MWHNTFHTIQQSNLLLCGRASRLKLVSLLSDAPSLNRRMR
jgi:hypothetical protein